ncbi:hypothetical protein GCM10009549_55770 [Streptomyces thermoalcalitolerans]|uniref:Uncharacterized protein n=1 Tax=Streptomyces thermoalcalitolerans TaxID=65605 RepID=A0ABP4A5R0_9ACTN
MQQPDRLPQPQRLPRALVALPEVLLDRRRLLRRTGGQRPRPEKRLQRTVLPRTPAPHLRRLLPCGRHPPAGGAGAVRGVGPFRVRRAHAAPP